MKNVADAFVTNVPKRGGVARDALANTGLITARRAFRAKTNTPFANPKAKPISTTKIMVMAGPTGYILIPA